MHFSDQAGRELDAWVAKAEGFRVEARVDAPTGETRYVIVGNDGERAVPTYSTSEVLADPIIERERIELGEVIDEDWTPAEQMVAWISRTDVHPSIHTGSWMGESAAAAAMLCYVASKFGEDWPDMQLTAAS